jgi:predicted nucleic acid-binding protein
LKVLLDTSILLRLRDADSPFHSICVQAIERLQDGTNELYISAQIMIEYWVVATRPREVNGFGLDPADVDGDLVDFEHGFRVLPEVPDVAERWRSLVREYSVRGRPAHDTRLVALMLAHEVNHILTLNPADFARYAEITVLQPANL